MSKIKSLYVSFIFNIAMLLLNGSKVLMEYVLKLRPHSELKVEKHAEYVEHESEDYIDLSSDLEQHFAINTNFKNIQTPDDFKQTATINILTKSNKTKDQLLTKYVSIFCNQGDLHNEIEALHNLVLSGKVTPMDVDELVNYGVRMDVINGYKDKYLLEDVPSSFYEDTIEEAYVD